jgi:hypothetical protein
MAVSDYSSTPGSNNSISGINIAENCSPANLNNAFRQLMADVRVFYDGVPSTATLMPKAGGTFSGTQPIYTGRGAYLHHNNAAFTSGRIFMQATGGSTPSGMVAGDILLEY